MEYDHLRFLIIIERKHQQSSTLFCLKRIARKLAENIQQAWLRNKLDHEKYIQHINTCAYKGNHTVLPPEATQNLQEIEKFDLTRLAFALQGNEIPGYRGHLKTRYAILNCTLGAHIYNLSGWLCSVVRSSPNSVTNTKRGISVFRSSNVLWFHIAFFHHYPVFKGFLSVVKNLSTWTSIYLHSHGHKMVWPHHFLFTRTKRIRMVAEVFS